MMNTKAKTTQILVLLILVVFTSVVLLLLINSGIVSVRAENNNEPILNTEFLPFGRDGTLVIKDFQFCTDVSDKYECVTETNSFHRPDSIHFRFVVESTTLQNQIMLVENYRLKDASGKVVLEVDNKNDLHVEKKTRDSTEQVYFKDFIVSNAEDTPGKYTLELFVENPLLTKKATLIKEFELR